MPPVPVLPPVKMQTSSASASPSTMATPTRPLFPGVCRLAQMLPVANTQPSISSTRVCLKYFNALAVISVLHLTHSMPCMMLLTPRVADCTTRHVLKFCSPAGPWTDPSSSQISPQRSPASAGKPNTSYAAATDAAAPALGAAVFTAGSAMPRSPGQQQGSAHSEATQRRSPPETAELQSHAGASPLSWLPSPKKRDRGRVMCRARTSCGVLQRGPLHSGASLDGILCATTGSCSIPLQHATVDKS